MSLAVRHAHCLLLRGRRTQTRGESSTPGHDHLRVFDLKKLEDFSGNYTAGGVGATAGGGAGATIMKNQNGVIIELTSTTQGASLKLAASGIRLTLEK